MSLKQEYRIYSSMCQRVMEHVLTDINDYLNELQLLDQRSPIVSVLHRIKTLDSVREKCNRKNYALTIDGIKDNVFDIAGIRIITLFEDDIYVVVKALKARLRLNIVSIKDYVKNPKPNGYRSVHIIAKKEFYFNEENHLIPIEIQIRTKAMDLWASLEHQLKYKNDAPDPRTEGLKEVADRLAAFDQMVMELRDSDPTTS